jgi:general secretion pathway protein H
LQAYALQTATLLNADRVAAISRRTSVATLVDAGARAIHSGARPDSIHIPDDVRFDAILPETCRQKAALSTISFFANGTSCGGAIALTRFDAGFEIRVNWLTGRVEIVSRNTASN